MNKKRFKQASPLVSIIVANYNNEQFIEECLESIMSQSYENIEIIVCDDNSTDNSKEILEKYNEQYNNISIAYNEQNKGVSYTRDRAIKISKGEYITTLDSDDIYFHQQKIENEMKLILFYKEQFNRDICAYSNTANIDLKSQFVGTSTPARARKEGDVFIDILSRSCFIPRDFIFKKSYYADLDGFNQQLTIFEDWDFKIRLASKLSFYYTSEFGTGYRLHNYGLSSIHKQGKKLEVLMEIFEKYFHLCSSYKNKTLLIILFQRFLLTRFDQKNHIENYIDGLNKSLNPDRGVTL